MVQIENTPITEECSLRQHCTVVSNQYKTLAFHEGEIHTNQPLTNGFINLFQGDIPFLLLESGRYHRRGWSPANKCGCRWVCQSGGDGEKSHSSRLLCLLSPLLLGDQAMLISRGDLRGLHPNDSDMQEKNKDVISKSVLKSCSGRILNWKHKWRLGEIQSVWKGEEEGQWRWESATGEGGGRNSKTSYAAQNYLANHLWSDYHRLSAQPHRGWLREQLIKSCFVYSSFYNISLLLLFLSIRQWKSC